MKQRLSGSQYEQLAMEKFQQIVESIPFVSQVKITQINQRFGDFLATVCFRDHRPSQQFCIEVKSNGETRFANLFVAEATQQLDHSFVVFMAPYISDRSAEIIREQNLSYMDLSGNCYLSTDNLFIQISGNPNLFKAQQKPKDYFSKSASAASSVMRTILNAPHSCWQVKQLAQSSKKSLGTVSNVKAFLKEHDWINESPSGFTAQNTRELLYTWAKDYHLKPARTQEFYSLDTIPIIESDISEYSKKHDSQAVLGGFSAAARYAPTVRYQKVHVYISQIEFNHFVQALDLQPVTSGGNVLITIPHDETPCMFAKTIHGDLVTSPVQTVIDLLGISGRGEEAADPIIRKEFEQEH